jgi:two-component system sensor histidine kinase RegB
MYLVQIVFAAFLLRARSTAVLLALAILSYGALFFWNIPVPQLASHHHDGGETFNLHLNGMFVAFSLLGILLSYFVYRLKKVLDVQYEENVRLEQKSKDAQKMFALTTLAAGAAHELCTPLASISVAAHEMERTLQAYPDVRHVFEEDVQLVQEQVSRCQKILSHMSAQAGEHVGEEKMYISLEKIQASILERVPQDLQTKISFHDWQGEIHTFPNAFLLSLSTLVKNALDAQSSRIECRHCVQGGFHAFSVADNGQGMNAEVLERLGEPFFTTKTEAEGMGLGFYLVQAFADRVGGALCVTSQAGKGTKIELKIPSESSTRLLKKDSEIFKNAA